MEIHKKYIKTRQLKVCENVCKQILVLEIKIFISLMVESNS